MSGEPPDLNIPEGYDMRRIIQRLLHELWISNRLDKAAVERIKDAGKPAR